MTTMFSSMKKSREISFNNLKFSISEAPIRETVKLRIVPVIESGMAEIKYKKA